MANVKTVLGEISGDELGIVDYHEHLCFDAPAWLLREDRDFTLNNVEKSADELRSWARAGGKTIIECSAIDFGRDIHAVRQIAELVPEVNVIALTGFNKPYYCDKSVFETSDEDHIRRCVRDITEGIDGTDYRAGIIKGGTGSPISWKRAAAEVYTKLSLPVLSKFSPSPAILMLEPPVPIRTVFQISSAMPRQSNPGPRFAVVAGTLIST